ncbi:MAG: restriction endonuclease subunit M [Lachnospiraceae bacterium]|nr:restriction endonuclease subunit M [Lachnospiraceae bacterium]
MSNIDNANRTEIERRIDILEDDIADINPALLNILLQDKTTKKNILWCTKDYEAYGPEYDEHEQIKANLITKEFYNVIQPRAAKAKDIQERRIKNRAEVFTPSWICNVQNNQVDEAWFGKSNVFNTPQGTGWKVNKRIIKFPKNKDWSSYVDSKRLEITCGEAPYLVSRYDTTTGMLIPVFERIGLFDRKMRVVNENCKDDESWLVWSLRAVKSIYGYEFQGDSILIARENFLYDYIDYYKERFKSEPPIKLLKSVANIIAWNIWQMDGLKYVVPYSCHPIKEDYQMSLFDIGKEAEDHFLPCPGCEKNNIYLHNGIYCRIFDWTNLNKSIPFLDVFKEDAHNG